MRGVPGHRRIMEVGADRAFLTGARRKARVRPL